MPTKVCLVKAMVFPVVVYGCESWTTKKAEYRRIDVFELWCWRRLLRVPWTARRSNQSILKEISPGCSLEGLMLKLKLQSFGHLIQRADSFWKDSDTRKDWGQKEKGKTEDEMVGWHHQHNGHGFVCTLGVGDGQGGLVCCSSWGCKESDTTVWLNWSETPFHMPLCSNLDGPRDCHTEWSQTKRNTWYHLYAESKQKGSKWTYKTETDSEI